MKKNSSKIFSRNKLIHNRTFYYQQNQISQFHIDSLHNLCSNIDLISRNFDSKAAYIGPHSYQFLKQSPANFVPNQLYISDLNTHFLQKELDLISNCEQLKSKFSNINILFLNNNLKLSPNSLNIIPICAYEEFWPFQENIFQIIISQMHLHWVNEVEVALSKYHESLIPDGLLIGNLFGSDTLEELRISYLLAENERYGGVSQHISPFISLSELGNLLNRLQLQMTTVCSETKKLNFESVYGLMQYLQESGENNALIRTRQGTFKDTLYAMGSIYNTMFKNADQQGIDATIQYISFNGWKYKKDQHKKMERGSAQFSITDFKKEIEKIDPEGAKLIEVGTLGEESDDELVKK